MAAHPLVTPPLLRRPIGAGLHEPMQHREEDGPLHRELDMPLPQPRLQHPLATAPAPPTLEDKPRPNTTGRDRGDLAVVSGSEQHHGFGKASPTAQQCIEWSAVLQRLQAPQCRPDPLFDLTSLAAVCDDWQVRSRPRLLGTEAPRSTSKPDPTICQVSIYC